MEKEPRKIPPVLASHLYDFVTCPHRIALDARLDRSERTPPDEQTSLLFKHGRHFEASLAAELDYPGITVQPGEWEAAADETLRLMREGVPGIYQGVLINGRQLAQPDFMERVEGRSALGDYHYIPGDAKSALHARSDAALQIAFAGMLLEQVQERPPTRGFVILGDRSREFFDLDSIRTVLQDVVEQVTAIADGDMESSAFFSAECLRCRWRGTCLQDLRQRQDASFTFGLTRTRVRVLRGYGVESVRDLAGADLDRLRRAGAPTDGLERAQHQAEVLIDGLIRKLPPVELPGEGGRRLFLHLECDPLDLGSPFLFCSGAESRDGTEPERIDAVLSREPAEASAAFLGLIDLLRHERNSGTPIYHYGHMTSRALDFMGERLRLDPALLGDLEGRMVDLAPLVRRAAILPVCFYDFDEVAAVAMNQPRPDPASPRPAPFLHYHNLLTSGSTEEENTIAEELVSGGRAGIMKLSAIYRWLSRLGDRSGTTMPPRGTVRQRSRGVRSLEHGERTVWERLERLLHREHHAVFLGHRELLALPVGERVDRGECLAGLRWINEEGGGRIRLLAGENAAKFRPGDRLRLGNGDPGVEGAPVAYESFNIDSKHLVVRRDGRFREPGGFDPLRQLQLDPEPTSLASLALDAIDRIRRLEGDDLSTACRRIIELEADETLDGDAAITARNELAADPRLAFLDAFQREAYVAAISRGPISLVQGPPGSGKTVLLARIVSTLARRGLRVLVTAYTHRAVNNALRKIVEADPGMRVFKVGARAGYTDLHGSGVDRVRAVRNLPPPGDEPLVAGLTIFGARPLWDHEQHDVVVIDEASQVPLAYAPIAMLAGKRFVMVGDHRQLGPIVQGRHEDPLAGLSVFEHLAERYRPVLLSITHRMNDRINELPSLNFYGGELRPSREVADARFDYRPGGEFDEVFDPAVPAVLATVNHEGFRTRSEPEARAVVDLVADALQRQGLDPDSLAVISPFRAQIRLIRTLLRKKLTAAGLGELPLPVVDTVERIQGQERELIIVSMTASDPDHLSGAQAEFFFSPRRLNVTLTRARTKLVLLASRHLFRALPRNLEQLRDADLYLRLFRTMTRIDLSPRYLKPTVVSRRSGPAPRL